MEKKNQLQISRALFPDKIGITASSEIGYGSPMS